MPVSQLLENVIERVDAYNISQPTVATPLFSLATDTYSSDQSVTITCATAGAVIYYTVDSSVPSPASSAYASPVAVSGDGTVMTIRAMATHAGMTDSAHAQVTVSIIYSQAAAPTFTPGAGTYNLGQTVTLNCATAGATIRYMLGGSTPDGSSPAYSTPFDLPVGTTTVTAKAFKSGMAPSASSQAQYIITSNNASLSGLAPSTGTLAPPFNASVTAYSFTVPNSVTSLTVTPTAGESHATILVNSVQVTSGAASGAIALAVGGNTITVLVRAQDGITTRTYTVTVTRSSPVWAVVGSGNLSGGAASYVSMDVFRGTPYVAYKDSTGDLTVKKWNGSAWALVGAASFSATTVDYVTLKVYDDGSGTPQPYVAFRNRVNWKEYVMKFSGTAWDLVPTGSTGISPGQANYPTLDMSGAVPYVAYADYNNGRIGTMKKYSGGAWVDVGTPATFSAGLVQFISMAVGANPCAAFLDSTNSNKLTVMECNSGIMWRQYGGSPSTGISAGQASYIVMKFMNSTPYVAYQDASKAQVLRYNGSGWEAVPVGSTGLSAGTATQISFFIYRNGTPFISYCDGNSSNKATVMKYTGSAWVTVGTAGFSSGTVSSTSLYVYDDGTANGIPYLAYYDSVDGGATVMKFQTY
jgi:hypothetical protein